VRIQCRHDLLTAGLQHTLGHLLGDFVVGVWGDGVVCRPCAIVLFVYLLIVILTE
jgi:hypothetical protein